ncbi:MAG: hydrolase, partial [Firmicutes bacterium]|nr:hydrolase [Bacillota bacterium]
HPAVPVIATGGATEESIEATIEAGANAISWTPPTTGDLFKRMMERYREEITGSKAP